MSYPNADEKDDLDRMILDWIQRDEREHQDYVLELNVAEDYFDNLQLPSGFGEYNANSFAAANDPATLVAQKNFVIVNKVLPTHESILGNFASSKQTVTCFARGMKDQKKAIPIKKAIQYLSDHNKTFIRVVFPAINSMLHTGLDWAKVWYNPFDRIPNGSIKEARISARDVLVDADSRDFFYEDTGHRIHRMRFLVKDAHEEFSEIEGFNAEDLKPDMDWSLGLSRAEDNIKTNTFCTIYYVEYVKREWVYKLIEGTNSKEISKEEYQKARSDGKEVIRDRDDCYYYAYYNKTTKTFFHKKCPWKCFSLVPLVNRRSENRVYPIGDFAYYKNLQDLFNIVMSIILDDVKEGRKWLVAVDPNTYNTKKDEIQKQIEEGFALIPANTAGVLKPPGLNEGVLQLLSLVRQAIDDIRSLPAVSKGELPAKQISEDTVKLLQASAAVSHGRKSIMINYFMTELAMVRYRMMVAMWDEEDFIRITDAAPGMPQYVPINHKVEGEDKYMEFLAKMSGIEFPEQGEIDPQMAQKFQRFQKKFEQENDVEVTTEERVQYTNKDGSEHPQLFTDKEYESHIQQSGMTPTEFVQKFGVRRKQIKLYEINRLNENVDIDLSWAVDFDIERNKARQQAMALALAEKGWVSPVDTMNELDVEDAEGKYERAQEVNQFIQLAKRIQEDEKFQQAVGLAEKIANDPKLMESLNAAFESRKGEPANAG